MRVETYYISAQLVRELDHHHMVKQIVNDGGDIIHLELVTGETLMIYLIESHIPLYEIRNILETNTRRDIYTMFILWVDMLLPDEGGLYEPPDWHRGLMAIYGGKIYGYEVYRHRAYLYPVFFDRISASYTKHRIRYGPSVNVGALHGFEVSTALPDFTGTWLAAGFDGDPHHDDRYTRKILQPIYALADYFAVLQTEVTRDRAVVRRAYRRLARRYHPDVNSGSAQAHEHMQKINHAYRTIMRALEDDK